MSSALGENDTDDEADRRRGEPDDVRRIEGRSLWLSSSLSMSMTHVQDGRDPSLFDGLSTELQIELAACLSCCFKVNLGKTGCCC